MNEDKEKKEAEKRFYLSIISISASLLSLIVAIAILISNLMK